MHTARWLTVSPSKLCSGRGGAGPGGVPGSGGCLPVRGGGCLPGPREGCLVLGGPGPGEVPACSGGCACLVLGGVSGLRGAWSQEGVSAWLGGGIPACTEADAPCEQNS